MYYIDDRLAADRPATDDRPLISKILNGNISATGHPIHLMFGFRIWGMVFGDGQFNGII